MGLAPLDSALVQVKAGGNSLPDFRAAIDATDPEVFLNSDGSMAAINQDGSVELRGSPGAGWIDHIDLGNRHELMPPQTGSRRARRRLRVPARFHSTPLTSSSFWRHTRGLRWNGGWRHSDQFPGSTNGPFTSTAGPIQSFSLSVGGKIGKGGWMYVSQ